MFPKRQRIDSECDEIRPRSESNERLNLLIREQLRGLNSNDLSNAERLNNIIIDQHGWIDDEDESLQMGDGIGTSQTRTELSRGQIDSLMANGGVIEGFTVTPRPRFNGVELQRSLDLRQIQTTDFVEYNSRLHNILNEVVDFSQQLAGQTGFINISLAGESLPGSINAVLTPDSHHDPSSFINQIEQVTQSNSDVTSDSTLTLQISIVRDKTGGGRRKISDLAIS